MCDHSALIKMYYKLFSVQFKLFANGFRLRLRWTTLLLYKTPEDSFTLTFLWECESPKQLDS